MTLRRALIFRHFPDPELIGLFTLEGCGKAGRVASCVGRSPYRVLAATVLRDERGPG